VRDQQGREHGDHASTTDAVQRQALGVGKRTLVSSIFAAPTMATGGPLQLQALQPNLAPDDSQVQTAAARGLDGPAAALPHLGSIQRAFGHHDVSGVSAHVGGPAAEASRSVGAEAYATGNHVAFAVAPSLHTAAHEAAHVVQQRAGVHLKGGVGAAGDPHEQHADAVADRVVAGGSVESLLDAYTPSLSPSPPSTLQRKPDAGGVAASPTSLSTGTAPAGATGADELAHLLAAPQPQLGSDPVVTRLERLEMPALLDQLSDAADCGYALRLEARIAGSPRLGAALQAVELARIPRVTAAHPALQRAGAALDQVSLDQQLQILSWMLHRRGVSVEATSLVEGTIATRANRDDAGASLDAANSTGAPKGEPTLGHSVNGAVASVQNTAAGAPAPINPGPWSPPGNQPGGWYVGTAAHTAIAGVYQAAHPADQVFTNTAPIVSILRLLTNLAKNPGGGIDALASDELARRPDIANMSRHHLYEIKPATAQAEAAAQARMYLSLFAKAGIEMTLGSSAEPGTFGALPAPAGVFMFQSPEPGVITYEYRRGRLVPVPVPEREPEPVRERRWRWELKPLTPMQKQAIVTTTVGGAMLIILMIILAPLGA